MPVNNDVEKAMTTAADVAAKDLQRLINAMSPEAQSGARAVADWIDNHFMKAGYKRLCRELRVSLSTTAKGGRVYEPKD